MARARFANRERERALEFAQKFLRGVARRPLPLEPNVRICSCPKVFSFEVAAGAARAFVYSKPLSARHICDGAANRCVRVFAVGCLLFARALANASRVGQPEWRAPFWSAPIASTSKAGAQQVARRSDQTLRAASQIELLCAERVNIANAANGCARRQKTAAAAASSSKSAGQECPL